METLYDMTKRLGKGQGESMMWDTVKVVSEFVDHKMSDKDKDEMMAKLHGMLSGGHFDEDYAVEAVTKMYYIDKEGTKRFAPYWTIPEVAEVYESVEGKIPKDYNEWDWYVTMQMVMSDNRTLLERWWPDIDMKTLTEKVKEMAVCWLNDPDSPYGTRKIWEYLHP